MTSRKMKCFSQQRGKTCAERGCGILRVLAEAAGCGRGARVLWGAPTPGLSSWVADMILGAQSPPPTHLLLGCMEGCGTSW